MPLRYIGLMARISSKAIWLYKQADLKQVREAFEDLGKNFSYGNIQVF